jgi:tetratricopeptide (TPR) repeat protein
MHGRFAQNPSYVQYETLLKELHALIAQGKCDSEGADAIRESMETLERHLNRPEIIRLNGLSADLYMLQDAEVLQPPVAPALDSNSLWREIKDAQSWNDWESVLGWLRRRPRDVPSEAVATNRARAYDALGHADTAILFLDHAFRRNPADSLYRSMRLGLLMRANRIQEAMAEAQSVISSQKPSPALLLTAADVLFQAAKSRSSASVAAEYRQILDTLHSVLKDTPQLSRVPVNDSVMGQLIRAGCHFAIGQHDLAIAALRLAVDADPADPLMRRVFEPAESAVDDGTRSLAIADALNYARDVVRLRDLALAA